MESMELIGVGETLANGAIVLASRGAPHYDLKAAIFLALANGTEFVTWVGDLDGGRTYAGHYFDHHLAAALADFEER